MDQDFGSAFYNRGNTHYELGRLNAALADYDRAIQIDDKDICAYHNRGITYHQLGMFDEALADFTYVLHLDPNYAEAYYRRHLTYLQRGQLDDERAARMDMDRYRRLTQSMARNHNHHHDAAVSSCV